MVTAGPASACALDVEHQVVCWGANADGQGDPPDGVAFQQIAAGLKHTCGLTLDGEALCWGEEGGAILEAPADELSWIAVASDHACGIRTDGSVICWGASDSNKLAVP